MPLPSLADPALLRRLLRSKSIPHFVRSFLIERFWRKWWANQELLKQDELREFPSPLRESERGQLVEAIAGAYPFSSALEIGCGTGSNFFLLLPLFPDAAYTGVDLSNDSVQQASNVFRNLGLKQVQFAQADARDLSQFPDRKFDITFTCASLLYAGDAAIRRAAEEMIRVSRHRLFLLEQHHPGHSAEGTIRRAASGLPDYWARDYEQVFCGLSRVRSVSLKRVPSPRFPTEEWRTAAHLVTVELTD